METAVGQIVGSTPQRKPLLLENSRRCIERAQEMLGAALEGYRRGGASDEARNWLEDLAEQVESLAALDP